MELAVVCDLVVGQCRGGARATTTAAACLAPAVTPDELDPEEWSNSGEPAAKGSLLGWTVFLVLVAALLVVEATVGFFEGPALGAHSLPELLGPVAVAAVVGAAYVLAWRDERFRPPHTDSAVLRTAAVLVFFVLFFGSIRLGIVSPVQAWLVVTTLVAAVVVGRAAYVFGVRDDG